MEISDLCAVLSGLSHPLCAVRRFTVEDSFPNDFEESHARTVLSVLPSLERCDVRACFFSNRARALWARRAPNCELKVTVPELEFDSSEAESEEDSEVESEGELFDSGDDSSDSEFSESEYEYVSEEDEY